MATTAVMNDAEANALFDQLERIEIEDEAMVLPDGIEAGPQTVVYPKRLPGKKVRIFDSKTGVPSEVLPYMLPKIMKFKYPDGTPRFSRTQVVVPPTGEVPCFLNPEHPDHEAIRAAGIVVTCRKKLLSVMHAERHAKTRHGDNWSIWQRAKEEKRDADARAREDRQYNAMMALAGNRSESGVMYACDLCDHETESKHGLKIHKGRDHKE